VRKSGLGDVSNPETSSAWNHLKYFSALFNENQFSECKIQQVESGCQTRTKKEAMKM